MTQPHSVSPRILHQLKPKLFQAKVATPRTKVAKMAKVAKVGKGHARVASGCPNRNAKHRHRLNRHRKKKHRHRIDRLDQPRLQT